MTQPGEKVWTPRFQLLVGLVLAGQIILGVIVYNSFGHSYTYVVLALTVVLLLCGIVITGILHDPASRKIVLGAGFFIVMALLTLIASPDFLGGVRGRQQAFPLSQFLSYGVLIIALLAFLGKVVTREKVASYDIVKPTSWFIRLSHVALAGIAGMELLFQSSFGNRLLLLPFTQRLYDGFSLNSAALLLLAALVVFSLLRFKSRSSGLDGFIVLILSAICFLFQYTFGPGELAGIDPHISQSQIVGINLVLSIAPLVLALFALFSEWGRFLAMLWLAIQISLLQQSVRTPFARAGAGGVFQHAVFRQVILYVLAIALIMLALRLVLFWERRRLNAIDILVVLVVALVAGVITWSVGQSYLQQAQPLLPTQRGINLLSLSYSLVVTAYLVAIAIVLALGLIVANALFQRRYLWLRRVENLVETLTVLAITLGALLLLNSIGSQNQYLASSTLTTRVLGANLPNLSLRNQYVLDGLFVCLLLIYGSILARERWNRTFAHTERILVLLSGCVFLLIVASPGKNQVLPLILSTIRQLSGHSLLIFPAGHIIAISILIAALVSVSWFTRSKNIVDRLVLIVLFSGAALCALAYYFSNFPFQLIVALMLLTIGTLVAARTERVQEEPVAETSTPETGIPVK